MNLLAQETGAAQFDLNAYDASPWAGIGPLLLAALLWVAIWKGLLAYLRRRPRAIPWTAISRWFPTGMTLLLWLPVTMDGPDSLLVGAVAFNLPALIPAIPILVLFDGRPHMVAILSTSVVVWVTWHALVILLKKRLEPRPSTSLSPGR